MAWANSDDISANGVIAGIIKTPSGDALSGATVVIMELNIGTQTTPDGQFSFGKIRHGNYTIQLKHLGYASSDLKINLASDTIKVHVILHETHIELREVIVQESSTGRVFPEKSLNIDVVGSEYLRESSQITLLQSLQRIPGINSMDIGAAMSKPVIRGLGFNRVVVAQYNLKQQGQQWGADHGLEIDHAGVERVEVLKGPASLVFGSDAIGGVLNIRPPVLPDDNKVEARGELWAQSNNDLLGATIMSTVSRYGRFFRFRVTLQDYADYRVPTDSFIYNRWVLPLAAKRLKNTSGEINNVSISGGLRKEWGISTITFSRYGQKSGFFPLSHGLLPVAALSQPGEPRKTDYPRQDVQHYIIASNSKIILAVGRLEVDMGFQQNNRQELNLPHRHGLAPLPETNRELHLILNSYSAATKFHTRFRDKYQIILGWNGSMQQNQRGGFNFLIPDYSYGETGLFVLANRELNHNNLFINAGLRVDFAGMESEEYSEPVWVDEQTIGGFRQRAPQLSRKYANLAFSGGISWVPADNLNLKTNLGSGFRNPAPVELTVNGIHHGSLRHEMGDASLIPERTLQWDMGLVYHIQDFYITITPFVNYFLNYIYLRPTGRFSSLQGAGQIYQYSQADAIHAGGEIYFDWHISESLHTSVGGEGIWAQNLETGFPLPFTPPASLLAEINYKLPLRNSNLKEIKLISSFRATSAQNRVVPNESATPGYFLTNTGIRINAAFGGTPLKVFFMVNNVFNVQYKNHISFYRILELPEPGRNFTLRISASLSK